MGHAGTAAVEQRDRSLNDDRVSWLIDENRRIRHERSLYRTDRERFEALTMRNPVKVSRAYRWFGFMLGSVPPAALVIKIAAANTGPATENLVFGSLIIFAGVLAGLAGFVSGELTARTVKRADKFAFPNRTAVIAFVGMTWGIACGAAGGMLIFLIGAIPAAFIGGVTAAISLPVFAMLIDLVRRGDRVPLAHFLPISIGLVSAIAAFVLGS